MERWYLGKFLEKSHTSEEHLRTCDVRYNPDTITLIALLVGRDISKENADALVAKFKDDEWISAYITDNGVLYIDARYPVVTVTCTKPGEKPYPLKYTLKL